MYDPMVAKLIVWDIDREHATRRMLRALDEYEVGGLTTLIPFHKAILATEQWAKGETCRDLMEDREWLKSTAPPRRRRPPSGGRAPRSSSATTRSRSRQALRRQGDRRGCAGAAPRRSGGGRNRQARTQSGGGRRLQRGPALAVAGDCPEGRGRAGREVEEGDLICVIEAMKMENEIAAHRSGKVTSLNVSEGAAVSAATRSRSSSSDPLRGRRGGALSGRKGWVPPLAFPFFLLLRRSSVPPACAGGGFPCASAAPRWRPGGRSFRRSPRAGEVPGGWFADREEVGHAGDVVQLLRVTVDVVELLLAVRPGDVLVGAEANPLVVFGRGEERRIGFSALRRALRPVLPFPPGRPPSPSRWSRFRRSLSTSLVSTNDSKRIGRRVRSEGSCRNGTSDRPRCFCPLRLRPVRAPSGRCLCSPPARRSEAFCFSRGPGSGTAGVSQARRRGTCPRSDGARRRRTRCRRRR